MATFDENFDIVEVVQKYINLQRRGRYYIALCPFHKETKPSFYVSPELQIFKCFGCGEGGNAIRFVMKIENLSYKDALSKIAEMFGFEIEKKSEKGEEIKKLIEINYEALRFFRLEFNNYPEVQAYLKSRGIKDESIEKFEIGFSSGGTRMRDYLYSKGYQISLMREAGLVDTQDNDRFQSRIIFPLRNERGHLVGFMGRIYPPNSEKGAKYLNSPNTKLFNKSNFLYGLNFAFNAIQNRKRVILVEGTIDVILAQQNGILETVATSGTALTFDHLRKLKRFTNNLVFAFDNDFAGFKALLKFNPIALNSGFKTFCLVYNAKDLGEFFESQTETKSLNSIPAFDFIIQNLPKYFDLKNLESKREALNYLLLQIKPLDSLEKEEKLSVISELFNVNKDFLKDSLAQINIPTVTETSELYINQDLSLWKLFILAQKLSYHFSDDDLPSEVKNLYYRIINNELNDEELKMKEMLEMFLLSEEIDLRKEFEYTYNYLKKFWINEKIESLKNWLRSELDDSDKILLELNRLSQELKKIYVKEKKQ